MTDDSRRYTFVLALYPNSPGLGYVLFDEYWRLADWGVRHTRGKRDNQKLLDFVTRLLAKYAVTALVLEDWVSAPYERARRIQVLYRQLVFLAKRKGVRIHQYSHDAVSRHFAPLNAFTRSQIALEVAKQVPEIRHLLPPAGQIWVTVDPRQTLYDAAALGLTHLASVTESRE